MESLYLLIPLGLFVVLAAAVVFLGAAEGGQFDDLAAQQQRLPDGD
jgi:cbb3-type cytochrome oxidase maturation protein